MSKLFDMYGFSVNKGEFIFKEGDPADGLYMVHKGSVEINKGSHPNVEKLDTINESEFFGEMGLINSLPRSANAIALADSQLIRMNKQSFESNIKDNHHFAIHVIRFLSDRLRATDDMLSAMNEEKYEYLYQNELLKLALKIGKKESSGKWILVSKTEVERRLRSQYNWSLEQVGFIQDRLIEKNVIEIKKVKSGDFFVAVLLPRVSMN